MARAGSKTTFGRITPRRWREGPPSVVERLWRSLKCEEVYLKAYDSVPEARAGIGAWLAFYNAERLHQALG